MNNKELTLVHKYYDGELSARAALKVEKLLENSPEAREELESISKIGKLVMSMNDENIRDMSFNNFYAQLSNKIKQARQPGFMEKISLWTNEFFENRRVIWVPVFATAVALLVISLLPYVVFKSESENYPVAQTRAHTISGQHAAVGEKTENNGIWTASVSTTSEEKFLSEIQSVNFTKLQGEVIKVEYGNGNSASVVWIEE